MVWICAPWRLRASLSYLRAEVDRREEALDASPAPLMVAFLSCFIHIVVIHVGFRLRSDGASIQVENHYFGLAL